MSFLRIALLERVGSRLPTSRGSSVRRAASHRLRFSDEDEGGQCSNLAGSGSPGWFRPSPPPQLSGGFPGHALKEPGAGGYL